MKLKREIEYQIYFSNIFDSFSGSSGSNERKNVTIFVNKKGKVHVQ